MTHLEHFLVVAIFLFTGWDVPFFRYLFIVGLAWIMSP